MDGEDAVYYVDNVGWFIKTCISPHGPFDTREEATSYLALLGTVSAARVAVGWSQENGPASE